MNLYSFIFFLCLLLTIAAGASNSEKYIDRYLDTRNAEVEVIWKNCDGSITKEKL